MADKTNMDDIRSLAGGILDNIQQKKGIESAAAPGYCIADTGLSSGGKENEQPREESVLGFLDEPASAPVAAAASDHDHEHRKRKEKAKEAEGVETVPIRPPRMPRRHSEADIGGTLRRSSRVLLVEELEGLVNDEGDSVDVKSILDDIGKPKTDVESAQDLLAIVQSFDEVRETLSITDNQQNEEGSLASGYTNPASEIISLSSRRGSFTSRMMMRIPSSRSLTKGTNGGKEHPVVKSPSIPLSVRPPVMVNIPKKKETNSKDEDLDTIDDDDYLDPDLPLESEVALPPKQELSHQNGVGIECGPKDSNVCQSESITISEENTRLLGTNANADSCNSIQLERKMRGTANNFECCSPTAGRYLKAPSPPPTTLQKHTPEKFPRGTETYPEKLHKTERAEFRYGLREQQQQQQQQHGLSLISASQTELSHSENSLHRNRTQHGSILKEQADIGKQIPPSHSRRQLYRDVVSTSKSPRLEMSSSRLVDDEFEGHLPNISKRTSRTKDMHQKTTKSQGSLPDDDDYPRSEDSFAIETDISPLKLQTIRYKTKQVCQTGCDVMKVNDSKHERIRRPSRHDQYLQMSKQSYGRRGSMSGAQSSGRCGSSQKATDSRPDLYKLKALLSCKTDLDRSSRAEAKSGKPSGDELPGRQVSIKARHKSGVPVIIEVDLSNSGRSVSPYGEKDDKKMDLNELAARMGSRESCTHYNHDVPHGRTKVRRASLRFERTSLATFERQPGRYIAGK